MILKPMYKLMTVDRDQAKARIGCRTGGRMQAKLWTHLATVKHWNKKWADEGTG
jgi:hypothetical protein